MSSTTPSGQSAGRQYLDPAAAAEAAEAVKNQGR